MNEENLTENEDLTQEETGSTESEEKSEEVNIQENENSFESDENNTEKSEEPYSSAENEEKEEIQNLKLQLKKADEELSYARKSYENLCTQYREFANLYPDVKITELNDSVWDNIKKGVPMAAAYALFERKQLLLQSKAENVNSKNKEISSGALGASKSEEFFSPSEVKAMSPSEVRANYSKIINSMSKWH